MDYGRRVPSTHPSMWNGWERSPSLSTAHNILIGWRYSSTFEWAGWRYSDTFEWVDDILLPLNGPTIFCFIWIVRLYFATFVRRYSATFEWVDDILLHLNRSMIFCYLWIGWRYSATSEWVDDILLPLNGLTIFYLWMGWRYSTTFEWVDDILPLNGCRYSASF